MGSIAGNASYMPQRNNSVDMIGELPDIDFFSIPGVKSATCCLTFRLLMALTELHSVPFCMSLFLPQSTTSTMTM